MRISQPTRLSIYPEMTTALLYLFSWLAIMVSRLMPNLYFLYWSLKFYVIYSRPFWSVTLEPLKDKNWLRDNDFCAVVFLKLNLNTVVPDCGAWSQATSKIFLKIIIACINAVIQKSKQEKKIQKYEIGINYPCKFIRFDILVILKEFLQYGIILQSDINWVEGR